MNLYTIMVKRFTTKKATQANSLLGIALALALSIAGIFHPLLSNQAKAELTDETYADIINAIDNEPPMTLEVFLKQHRENMSHLEVKAIIKHAIMTNNSITARIVTKICSPYIAFEDIFYLTKLGIRKGQPYVVGEMLKNHDIDPNVLLEYATRNKKTEVVDYILSNYADRLKFRKIMRAFEVSLEENDAETAKLFFVKHIELTNRLSDYDSKFSGEPMYEEWWENGDYEIYVEEPSDEEWWKKDKTRILVEKDPKILYKYYLTGSYKKYRNGVLDALYTDFYLRIFPVAVRHGNLTVVKALVEAIKEVEVPPLYTVTLFQEAAKAGQYDVTMFLLEQYKEQLTRKEKLKAFVASAFGGNGSILKVLMQDIGVDNIPSSKQKLSLDYAAQNGHLRVVRILLKTFGKQFNAATLEKAKQGAIKNQREQVVKFLTEYRK
jgi:hypothetical protein